MQYFRSPRGGGSAGSEATAVTIVRISGAHAVDELRELLPPYPLRESDDRSEAVVKLPKLPKARMVSQ